MVGIEAKNNALRKEILGRKKIQADQAKQLTRLEDQAPYQHKVLPSANSG